MFDDAPQNAIVPRATVSALVSQRNAILAAYEVAYADLVTSNESTKRANLMLQAATPGITSYNYHSRAEKSEFLAHSTDLVGHEKYMAMARRLTDTDIWTHLIRITDLERLMDKKAKDQFRQQLIAEPPEVTEDNVFATLEQLFLDADMIFKRGIAECFSNLDRRFRSHDGWEIGARVILSYCFDEYGGWNYHRNHDDTMADIERVFYALDGSAAPPACQIVQKLRDSRGWGKAQKSFIETEFFRVRAFKNGNAHIWFKRDDLLVKVNQLLGEYYGAPIPEDRDAEEHTGLHDPKTTLAKNFGFFPTPDIAADIVIENVFLWRNEGDDRLRILEPSAGTGQLAKRCAKKGAIVDCVEVQPVLAINLHQAGIYNKIFTADFLQLDPGTTGLYDRVVMNPPFDRERDIDHVMHALKFLKPGGRLTAVMSASTEFRNTKKSEAFRKLMESMRAEWRDLPAGSFSEVGTNCNTRILKVSAR